MTDQKIIDAITMALHNHMYDISDKWISPAKRREVAPKIFEAIRPLLPPTNLGKEVLAGPLSEVAYELENNVKFSDLRENQEIVLYIREVK